LCTIQACATSKLCNRPYAQPWNASRLLSDACALPFS